MIATVARARGTLAALGLASVPLYVTEFGWPTLPPHSQDWAPDRLRPGYIQRTITALGHINCGVAMAILYTWVTPRARPRRPRGLVRDPLARGHRHSRCAGAHGRAARGRGERAGGRRVRRMISRFLAQTVATGPLTLQRSIASAARRNDANAGFATNRPPSKRNSPAKLNDGASWNSLPTQV